MRCPLKYSCNYLKSLPNGSVKYSQTHFFCDTREEWENCPVYDPDKVPAKAPASSGGGCFIATACYGNFNAPEVLALRAYRDEWLLTNWLGTAFVKFYYFVSPPLAKQIEKSNKAKNFIRKYLLSPIVRKVNQKLMKTDK